MDKITINTNVEFKYNIICECMATLPVTSVDPSPNDGFFVYVKPHKCLRKGMK